MKPIKLVMKAFGPYGKEAIVDFGKIGDHGLYLITGDTGAGKTTIFDAISFALYGEGAGGKERRQAKSFRSDYAKKEDETVVELTFEHKRQTYKITRQPEYLRPKQRGEGFTTKPASAILECLDSGEVYSRLDTTNKKIIEIIGLSKDQFNQTMMIAQGDFLKILKAKSDDRKQLFQKLFNTQIYEQLQEKLRDLNTKYQGDVDQIHRQIEHYYKLLEFDNTYDVYHVQDVLDTLKQQKKELQLEIQELKKVQETKTKQQHTLIEQVSQAKIINEQLQVLKTKKEQLEKLQSQEASMAELKQTIDEMKKALNVAGFVKEYDRISHEISATNQSIQSYKQQLEMFELETTTLTPLYEDATKAYQTINQLVSQRERLEKTEPILYKYQEMTKKMETIRKEELFTQNTYQEAQNAYFEGKKAFYENQYGIIASQIKEGEACPICGSTNHPKLASLTKNAISQEALERLEKRQEEVRLKYQQAKDKVLKNEMVLASYKQQMEDNAIDPNMKVADLTNQIVRLKEQEKQIQTTYEQLSFKMNKNQQNKDKVSGLLQAKEEQLTSLKQQEKDGLQALLAALKDNGFKDLSEYAKVNVDEKQLISLEKQYLTYTQQLISLKDYILTTSKQLEGKSYQDIKVFEEQLSILKNELNAIEKDLSKQQMALKNNQNIDAGLKELKKKQEAIYEKWTLVHDLHQVISGQEKGKAKLRFETYVQRYYFKQVIVAANKRLNVLTNGLFVLRCKEDVQDLRTQSGLDLDVFDKTTGQWRDVSTLSGGESFMASLALALGLSDIVSSQSGQIRLDAMFIDEGFGSLDEASLQQALSLLSSLSDGHRLIGIISHVSELKNSIEKKIIITKTNQGSKITIEA